MRIAKKFQSKIDAVRLKNIVKKDFPRFADQAHALIAKCLKEEDEQLFRIFLGQRDEYYIPGGLSHERFRLMLIQRDICRLLIHIERNKLSQWTDIALEWQVRRMLNLPYQVIKN